MTFDILEGFLDTNKLRIAPEVEKCLFRFKFLHCATELTAYFRHIFTKKEMIRFGLDAYENHQKCRRREPEED